MTDEKKQDRDLAILDAAYHEAGLDAADEASKRKRTPEQQAKVDGIMERAQASLRAARAQAFTDAQDRPATEPTKPIPARILAMAREAIVERLRELTQGEEAGGLQPALQFRNLENLPTADLQRVLADLEDQLGEDAD